MRDNRKKQEKAALFLFAGEFDWSVRRSGAGEGDIDKRKW